MNLRPSHPQKIEDIKINNYIVPLPIDLYLRSDFGTALKDNLGLLRYLKGSMPVVAMLNVASWFMVMVMGTVLATWLLVTLMPSSLCGCNRESPTYT